MWGIAGVVIKYLKLLKLDTEQLQHAISTTSVQVTGMHESFSKGTQPFHAGRTARNGMIAAVMAQQGCGTSLEGLEADRGWAHVVSARENLTAEVDTLGQRWEIALNTFKPYPCDRIVHAAFEARRLSGD